MKQLILAIGVFTVLFMTNCKGSKSTATSIPDEFAFFGDTACYIKFNQKINGLDVKIKVSDFVSKDSMIKGKADIAFLQNDKLLMTFHNPYFKLENLETGAIRSGEVYIAEYNYPDLDYNQPISLGEFRHLPFFFLDINFDGVPELILNYAEQGQHGQSLFVAFGLLCESLEKGDISYKPLYDNINGSQPYSGLDCLSMIFYPQKKIETYWYNTYDGNLRRDERRIYKVNNGEVQLDKIEFYNGSYYLYDGLYESQEIKRDTTITYYKIENELKSLQ